MAKAKTPVTKPGHRNVNEQYLVVVTDLRGKGRFASRIAIVQCMRPAAGGKVCGHMYATNYADVFDRRCPTCQNPPSGKPKVMPGFIVQDMVKA